MSRTTWATTCRCGHANVRHVAKRGGGPCRDCTCTRFRVWTASRARRAALVERLAALRPRDPDLAAAVSILVEFFRP